MTQPPLEVAEPSLRRPNGAPVAVGGFWHSGPMEPSGPAPDPPRRLTTLHLAVGWWSLLLFLTVGFVLEALHGFKVLAYLDPGNEMRRFLWRLGHAHGSLLSLVHIAFALTVRALFDSPSGKDLARLTVASRCLTLALVLLPGGFVAGGTILVRGEPNPAVLLVPLGALVLFAGVALTAWAIARGSRSSSPPS